MRERQRHQRAASKDALIQGAVACFLEFGYTETTVEKIAQAAGLSHATFYKYFESKEALLLEMGLQAHRAFVDQLSRLKKDRAEERLSTLVRRTVDVSLQIFETQYDLINVFMRTLTPTLALEPGKDFVSRELRDAVVEFVEWYGAQHQRAIPNPEAVALALIGVWVRVGLNYLANLEIRGSEVDRRETVDLITRMTLGLLTGILDDSRLLDPL
ncbi:MAG: TetR/AcrR family transcriptional regulator [Myxococcales bacterium]|nr:TetR/AcrR family transcriptional regulator [Myxococcales bacterium]